MGMSVEIWWFPLELCEEMVGWPCGWKMALFVLFDLQQRLMSNFSSWQNRECG
jgi:hypothetical protein